MLSNSHERISEAHAHNQRLRNIHLNLSNHFSQSEPLTCRTSDHILTLKTLVKKHVTIGGSKLYACFVDLKKAYDSVPHKSLFTFLRRLGLGGKIIDFVEELYAKTKCAVKIKGKITDFF